MVCVIESHHESTYFNDFLLLLLYFPKFGNFEYFLNKFKNKQSNKKYVNIKDRRYVSM